MRYSEDTSALRIRLDVHQGTVSPGEFQKMKASLDSLQKAVEKFPISDLHILVEHNERSNDYSVKTSLLLTGGTLVASEHAPQAFTAFAPTVSRPPCCCTPCEIDMKICIDNPLLSHGEDSLSTWGISYR